MIKVAANSISEGISFYLVDDCLSYCFFTWPFFGVCTRKERDGVGERERKCLTLISYYFLRGPKYSHPGVWGFNM